MIQGELDLGDSGQQRWTQFRCYDVRRPEIKAMLIQAMREDLLRYERCTIQGAVERVRLMGHSVTHRHRASFARQIKAECVDLAPYIVIRQCDLDSSM